MRPKKTITYIEPLTKCDILGVVSIFGLEKNFHNANGVKVEDLRVSLKKFVVGSKSNAKLKNI